MRNGSTSVRASCRDVEAGSGWSRPSTIKATRALVSAHLIAKREGTATRPAAYLLRFAETLRMGGKAALPPVDRNPQTWVVNQLDQVVKPVDHLNDENPSLFDLAPGVLSIDRSSSAVSEGFIDRSADSLPVDPEHAKKCSQLMLLFVRQQLRWANPHPPDKKIVAVMLRVAEWPEIENFLLGQIKARECHAPRNVGKPYAWLVTVALNQIHGIAADEQKPTLELLRGGKQLFSRWHTEGAK